MSSYQCSKCDFISKTKGTAKTHINSSKCEGAKMIENIVLIKCEMCGKECETEKLMNLHKKNCVKKRIEIINEDTNGELKKQNTEMMNMILSLVNEVDECRNENKDLKKRLEKLEKINEKEENIEDIDYKATCQYTRNKGPRVENRNQIFKYFGWDTDESRKRCEFLVNDRVESGLIHLTYIEANGVYYIFDSTKKKKNEKNVTDLIIYDPEDCTKRAKKYSNKHEQCCCLDHLSYYE